MNYNSIKNKIFSENPAVKAEYDQLGPQYEAIRAAIASRKSAGLTQKQLAEKMGTAQANISRFENGNANPSLDFLHKYFFVLHQPPASVLTRTDAGVCRFTLPFFYARRFRQCQCVCHRPGAQVLGLRIQMCVNVGCGGNIAVTQPLLNLFHRHALFQQ